MEKETFYPSKKGWISPSALDNWLRSRSAFIKTYFEGEKGPETAAMNAGTKVHKLIEAGLIKAKCVYDVCEQETTFTFENGVKVLGFPDSYTSIPDDGQVRFVDYKTGKANGWEEKLPTDIKMKTTAWLVWQNTGKPDYVHGAIEFIQTTWDPDTKEVVPIEGKESELVTITYTAKELEEFTGVILQAIDDINAFYVKWLDKTDVFINDQDIQDYADLLAKETELTLKIDEVADRIKTQMEAGGIINHKTGFGTFYLTTRKTYDYPDNLLIRNDGMTLKDASEIATQAKVAQKNYELMAEPKTESTSMGFRVAKQK